MTGEIYDGARVGVQRQRQHLDQHWHVCRVLHNKIRNLEGKRKQQAFLTSLHTFNSNISFLFPSFPQPLGLTFCKSFCLDVLRTASCSGTLQPRTSQSVTIFGEFHTNKFSHQFLPCQIFPVYLALVLHADSFVVAFLSSFIMGRGVGWGVGGVGGGGGGRLLLLLFCTAVTPSWSYQYS